MLPIWNASLHSKTPSLLISSFDALKFGIWFCWLCPLGRSQLPCNCCVWVVSACHYNTYYDHGVSIIYFSYDTDLCMIKSLIIAITRSHGYTCSRMSIGNSTFVLIKWMHTLNLVPSGGSHATQVESRNQEHHRRTSKSLNQNQNHGAWNQKEQVLWLPWDSLTFKLTPERH